MVEKPVDGGGREVTGERTGRGGGDGDRRGFALGVVYFRRMYLDEADRSSSAYSGSLSASRMRAHFSSSDSLALSSQEVGGGLRFGSLPIRSFDLMLPIARMDSICSRVNVSSVIDLTLEMCVCEGARDGWSARAERESEKMMSSDSPRVAGADWRTLRRG